MYHFRRGSLFLLIGLLGMAQASAAAAPQPDTHTSLFAILARLQKLESVEMLGTILGGQPPGPGGGWFHASQSRYDWQWLARRLDANNDGTITRREFHGPQELFQRLDRNHDGRLTAEDFDWSAHSAWLRQANQAKGLLHRADRNGDGRISAEEWQTLFRKAAHGKDTLTADDLHVLLFPPPAQEPPSSMPSPLTLLCGLLQGEIGSLYEGPLVGQRAPDFVLKDQDGKEVSLAQYRGKKPVVLVFGSFT